jgi:GT2 family glycosyltransferase
MPEHIERNFASKAYSFNTGYQKVKDIDSDIIVNLDADISFEKDFFEFLLKKFSQIPELGVAGTRFFEDNNKTATYSHKYVSGQCQMFGRECFKDIGEKYAPMKYGGVDDVAVLTAQMRGWKTMTFDEKTYFHHRSSGTANRNKWSSKIHFGRADYILGNHPLWEFFRVIFQMTRRPYLISGMLLLFGYAKASLNHTERISQDLIDFQRKEQIKRLKLIFKDLLKFKIRLREN